MTRLFKRLWADQSGATAIEYGLIVALLSVVVAAATTALGSKLYTMIANTANAIH